MKKVYLLYEDNQQSYEDHWFDVIGVFTSEELVNNEINKNNKRQQERIDNCKEEYEREYLLSTQYKWFSREINLDELT